MEKPEDFIFPARPFDAKRGLKNIEDIIIQIPTGRKTKDNQEETIPCLFKKTPNSNKLLIFFHCNGGDMFYAYLLLTKILENFNFNLLFPEYPGYTIYNSPKSSQKCFDDALIIYDFCLKNMKNLTEKNIVKIPFNNNNNKKNKKNNLIIKNKSFDSIMPPNQLDDIYKKNNKQ